MVLEMDGILICGGDFNILMNNKLDTTNKNKNTTMLLNWLRQLLKNLE